MWAHLQERYLDDRDPDMPYPGMVLVGRLLAVCAVVRTDVGGRQPGVYVPHPDDRRVEVVGRVVNRVPLWPDDSHAALLDCGFPVWVEPRMLRLPDVPAGERADYPISIGVPPVGQGFGVAGQLRVCSEVEMDDLSELLGRVALPDWTVREVCADTGGAYFVDLGDTT